MGRRKLSATESKVGRRILMIVAKNPGIHVRGILKKVRSWGYGHKRLKQLFYAGYLKRRITGYPNPKSRVGYTIIHEYTLSEKGRALLRKITKKYR